MTFLDRLLANPAIRIAFGFTLLVFGAIASQLDMPAGGIFHGLLGVYFVVSGLARMER